MQENTRVNYRNANANARARADSRNGKIFISCTCICACVCISHKSTQMQTQTKGKKTQVTCHRGQPRTPSWKNTSTAPAYITLLAFAFIFELNLRLHLRRTCEPGLTRRTSCFIIYKPTGQCFQRKDKVVQNFIKI